ncbi:MAG TPA: carbamoyltransferase C-terminal domain-containing protein [Opitutaceae bacterium]|nr:carbamoyltransferase C-terminal domain-containing protein [Opitutaceae bacterium]
MTVLGLTGGLDAAHETAYDLPFDFIHDAAAVLVRDGRVEAAVEEERLNRIKHTNKAPRRALRFCLERAGLRPEQLDAVAFYATEAYCQRVLQSIHLAHPEIPELLTPRGMVQRFFREEFGTDFPAAKVHFVDHHWAHAVSAYALSGFDSALVVTLDGQGEGVSGAVYAGRGRSLEPLRRIPEQHSLGYLYRDVIKFLGYEMFDEYKVMGMAPYGDPARYRPLFRTFYELLPEGEYRLHLDRVMALFRVAKPRRRGGDFTGEHRDIAAALQEATEEIGLHVLGHFRRQTGLARLCLAGGVAHNCSLNGRILYAGLFERMLVQPAAHDAGCALGAALAVQLQLGPDSRVEPLRHVFWGPEPGSGAEIERELGRWRGLLRAEKRTDIVERAADLLAEGRALGWVQGRSEFGPRALGHRSILADPRPAANKDVINAMVKKREAYRPFAPSVLAEAVDTYFETAPGQKEFPYMSVILRVRPEWRERLGAVTHVDGTARVQTVARDASPRYWELIRAFGARTGVEMLLNTSFNNHAEPIVDSARDAVACFLTTGLQALVVGDWLVTKQEDAPSAWLDLRPSLVPAAALSAERRTGALGAPTDAWRIGFTYHHGRSFPISPELYRILGAADGRRTLRELGAAAGEVAAIRELWGERVIALEPPA